MTFEDDDFTYSDEEIDVNKHQKLLDKVLNLNKAQKVKKPSRTEPTLKISEFDLVKSLTGKKGSVHLDDLTKILDKKKSHVKIKKKVDNATKISRTLPKPLEKPLADRIRRAVAYEKARLELDRWEPIVTSNRVSTDLIFPLPSSKNDEKEELTSRWRLKTAFDLEMDKIYPPQVEEIHVNLEKEKLPMTMKEIMEQRKDAAKLRAHQSYREAKARRQNKIKSKKFHRILRKEKIKQQLKEFELLQKTDPEEALKKLEEIERIRAHERFSLRHKSTGKWAKSKQIRAKYDKESRQELAQQLTISKELTQKVNTASDSEDDFIPQDEEVKIHSTEKNNPWVNNFKVDKEVTDFVDSYRKYWSEKNEKSIENCRGDVEQAIESRTENSEKSGYIKNIIDNVPEIQQNFDNIQKKQQKDTFMKFPSQNENTKATMPKKEISKLSKRKSKNKTKRNLENSLSTSDWDVEMVEGENIDAAFDKLEKTVGDKLQQKLKRLQRELEPNKSKKKKKKTGGEEESESLLALPVQKRRPKLDEALLENGVDDPADLKDLKRILEKRDVHVGKKKENEINKEINELNNKIIDLDTEIPDILTNGDNDDEIGEDSFQRELIAEAFQDSDLLEEFAKEKSDEIEKDKPKDINLTLPGWGSWGGTGIVPSKRKQKRFILKAPKKVPRRDDNKGFLIINEDASKKIKEHLVDDLPFPFQRVKDFEASIRAPIGRTFVPETAFRRLIKPAIRTKIGTIIEPMDKDVLLNKSS